MIDPCQLSSMQNKHFQDSGRTRNLNTTLKNSCGETKHYQAWIHSNNASTQASGDLSVPPLIIKLELENKCLAKSNPLAQKQTIFQVGLRGCRCLAVSYSLIIVIMD